MSTLLAVAGSCDDSPGSLAGLSGTLPAWYAVQVKRLCETRVHTYLSCRSIPAFLPLIEIAGRGRVGRVVRLEPLFPCYLFVRLERLEMNPSRWHAVRWAPGVRLILGADHAPVPVPDEAVEALRERVRDLGFVRPGARFAPHSRVRIRSGPLAGLGAVFDRPLSRTSRVRVLLTLLGQERRVEVDPVDLERA